MEEGMDAKLEAVMAAGDMVVEAVCKTSTS